ncbi:hypothetical protein HDG40_002933 [Paraburkholderia sp. JPY158]|uniref:Uncharacterized protein n=1 Tax=Paraburkholderia atlantica TaxID=2654982 RepID=A0A7W8Q7P7_PARAM|nr:hypothetical protein [Paraburkholderia atlantica]
MHTPAMRDGRPPRAAPLVAAAAYVVHAAYAACGVVGLITAPSTAQAHAIAGNRVFPATLAVDDPGVGDEANFEYGHQRVPGDNGDQSINTFSFEYDKLITPRLAVSIDGAYAMQNNPRAAGFNNFGVGLKYLLYVNEPHELMTSIGVTAELGGTGSRAIADNFSTISPTVYIGKGMGDLPDSLAYLRPVAITAEAGPALTTGAGQPNAFNYGFTVQYSLPYLQQHVHDAGLPQPFANLIPLVEIPLSRSQGTDDRHGQSGLHLDQSLRTVRRRGADSDQPRERLARRHPGAGASVLRRHCAEHARQAAVPMSSAGERR